MVEAIRLAIVLFALAAGYAASTPAARFLGAAEPESLRLVSAVLGALSGYVAGGMLGRAIIKRVDRAQTNLQQVDAAVLVSGALGATLGVLVAVVVSLPILILPAKQFTVPIAMLLVLLLAYGGGLTGANRGGDLSRWVGVRGRLNVVSPSRGGGTMLIDTSALMDGRIVDVARAGFLAGTLVVPQFVLEELQSQADVEDPRRRDIARRGLDALRILQDEHLVGVEVTDEDAPEARDVDAKLAAVCRRRSAALITVDANLARLAEISGLRVLNLHALAEAMRAPVLPGDELSVRVMREGQQPAQGVGYLPDGTMVVIERAAAAVGEEILVMITSITQTRQGRMLFARRAEEADVIDHPHRASA